jgi:tetratricopeptide (TPR) repeat protein
VPDAVLDHQGRGETATRAAKSSRDFLDAADAFGEAARLAPWLAENHFNRGIVLEKAERYDAAEQALQLYLKAAPNAKDAADVRKRIAGLRYLKEKATRAQAETRQQQERRQEAERRKQEESQQATATLQSLAGKWVIPNDVIGDMVFQFDALAGNRFDLYAIYQYDRQLRHEFHWNKLQGNYAGTMEGTQLRGTYTVQTGSCPYQTPFTGEILDGGRRLVLKKKAPPCPPYHGKDDQTVLHRR